MSGLHPMTGGIVLPLNRRRSRDQPITSPPLPGQLVLPLQSLRGHRVEPCVAVGERVLKGQPIARPLDGEGVARHAPTSGVIAAIEPRPVAMPERREVPAILLRSDGRDEWVPHRGLDASERLDRPALLARIRDAGICGLGGAGFPTAAKLASARTVETLLINGVECEPYVTADERLMRERPEQIVDGAALLGHLLQARTTLIAIGDDKPEALAAIRTAVAGSDIQVIAIPARYPSGGERQLVQIISGREIPSGGQPADIGIHCHSVATAAAVHRAVRLGEPLISRITTVTGAACAAPGNFEVLIGTPISHLLDASGFDAGRCQRLVVGGPLMGFAIDDPVVPLLETDNCILALDANEAAAPGPSLPCIRCGHCATVCPAALLPQQLYHLARNEQYAQLEAHHLFDCIECGACAYVCPSRIPLVDAYRTAKADIELQQRQRQQADRARARFEARNARLAREAEEKQQQRLQRAANRTTPIAVEKPKPADTVRAAVERARAKRADTAPGPPPTGAEADPRLQLQALERRLANAEQRLAQAREQKHPKLPHFEINVAQLRERIAALQARVLRGDPPVADDPARDAVVRAFTTHQQRMAQRPDRVTALQQRLAQAEAQLANARESNAGRARTAALENSVARLRESLARARDERDSSAGEVP